MTGEILAVEVRRELIRYFTPTKEADRWMVRQGHTKNGIPLTQTTHGKFRYPLFTMERGEFFFVPNRDGRSTEQTNNSVTSSVNHCRRLTGRQFAQRRFGTGVKVWRIA